MILFFDIAFADIILMLLMLRFSLRFHAMLLMLFYAAAIIISCHATYAITLLSCRCFAFC